MADGTKSSSAASRHQDGKQFISNASVLNIVHLLFLPPFSGLEPSLPFLSTTFYAVHSKTVSLSVLNGCLPSLMDLIASLVEGTVVSRLPPLVT